MPGCWLILQTDASTKIYDDEICTETQVTYYPLTEKILTIMFVFNEWSLRISFNEVWLYEGKSIAYLVHQQVPAKTRKSGFTWYTERGVNGLKTNKKSKDFRSCIVKLSFVKN